MLALLALFPPNFVMYFQENMHMKKDNFHCKEIFVSNTSICVSRLIFISVKNCYIVLSVQSDKGIIKPKAYWYWLSHDKQFSVSTDL